jgi:hypothetical protein
MDSRCGVRSLAKQLSLRDVHDMNYAFHAETGYINFSPIGFKVAARDFRRCADMFKPPKFSIVPYFLYCRAIELGLKSIHLETCSQQEAKDQYSHDLIKAYKSLPSGGKCCLREI